MTTTQNSTTQTRKVSYVKPVSIGFLLGLILISFFVFVGAKNPPAEWGNNWQIKPMILTPIISGLGGLFYFFMDYLSTTGFNRTLAVLIGIVGMFIALWMGMVLGLNGTMWN